MNHFAAQLFRSKSELMDHANRLNATHNDIVGDPLQPDWKSSVQKLNPDLPVEFYLQLDAIRGEDLAPYRKTDLAQVIRDCNVGTLSLDDESAVVKKQLTDLQRTLKQADSQLHRLLPDTVLSLENSILELYCGHGETGSLRDDTMRRCREPGQLLIEAIKQSLKHKSTQAKKRKKANVPTTTARVQSQQAVLRIAVLAFGIRHPLCHLTTGTDATETPGVRMGPFADYLECVWNVLPTNVRPRTAQTFIDRGFKMVSRLRKAEKAEKVSPLAH